MDLTSPHNVLKCSSLVMKVRKSHPDDCAAIEVLCQSAHRKLPRMWWWEEYLAEELFVVTEEEGIVTGALLAWPDESPVAWVRMAVLSDALGLDRWLDLVLSPILERLPRYGVRKLAWMDCDHWVGGHLEARGFERLAEVMTLIKRDRALPSVVASNVRLRQGKDGDVPAVVAVDRAAFTPHWWCSGTTMRRRTCLPSHHFSVAELRGRVVGYTEGELCPPAAHINRIAVHPTCQGHSVGALLLQDALRAFWRCGAECVTLNTQVYNRRSRRLYRRFGFEPIGDVTAVWELQL